MAKCFSFWVVVCLTVLIPNNLNKNDILALADLDLGNVYVDVNLDPAPGPQESAQTDLNHEESSKPLPDAKHNTDSVSKSNIDFMLLGKGDVAVSNTNKTSGDEISDRTESGANNSQTRPVIDAARDSKTASETEQQNKLGLLDRLSEHLKTIDGKAKVEKSSGIKDFGEFTNVREGLQLQTSVSEMERTNLADQPKTTQVEQGDEPSEPNEPDSVEITLSDTNPKDGQGVGDGMADSEPKTDMLKDPDSEQINAQHDNFHDDDNNENDRTYGNPPVLSETDLLNIAHNIPADLSSEEREKLRENISESLGLSAFGPGLAMLPQNQVDQTVGPERSTTPSTVVNNPLEHETILQDKSFSDDRTNIVVNSDPEVSQSQNSLDNTNNIDTNLDNDMNNNAGSVESEYEQTENYGSFGRKVLNEEEKSNGTDDDYNGTDDDYKFTDADSYFYNDYDEDEDNYIGGDVLDDVTLSSKDASTPSPLHNNMEGKPKDDLEISEDKLSKFDENPTSSQLTSLEVEDKDPLDTDQSFDYKEEDDEWYYDPEAAHVKESQTVSSTLVTSRPALDASSQNVDTGAVADMNKPEKKTEIPLTVVKEDPLSIKDVHVKKPLQAPKGTIILYTAIIVVFIACIVLFSAWKNPFNNGRPLHQHQTPIIRTGEEGKRLLDHPFV